MEDPNRPNSPILVVLAIVLGCYQKMWDFVSPLESLFMECVPPQQRGRFFAIRGILYTYIRCSPGGIPSIMIWMFFGVINGTFDSRINTFLGPMIYDYMPTSKMGTIIHEILVGRITKCLPKENTVPAT